MKIPGLIYAIIGAIIGIVSFFNYQLRFFMYVGGLMFFYGLLKLLWDVAKSPKKEKKVVEKKQEPTHIQQHQEQSQQQHHHAQQYHPQHSQYTYKICPNCQYHMHTSYRFCPRCGYGV